MEHEVVKFEELEDGEILDSDDGGYHPLQRPNIKLYEKPNTNDVGQQEVKMDDVADDIEESASEFVSSSDTNSDSDSDDISYLTKKGNKKKRKKPIQRTILKRVVEELEVNNDITPENNNKKKAKFQKYNIWTESLQEESLTETMRDCGVNKNKSDRNVEQYDYMWKRKENKNHFSGFKRRMSSLHNSSDDLSDNNLSDNNLSHKSKRTKLNNRKPIRDRSENHASTSSCDSQNAPRHILDLNINSESDNIEIAKDVADKLGEKKDELIIRIFEVVGKQIPIQIFKETQRIEKDGGMMTMDGARRRTPGGVFLFLIKHHDNISEKDKTSIFDKDERRKKTSKEKRDKKVEELKKQLSLKEKEVLPALSNRVNTVMCHLKPNTTTLLNPPPSPVTNSGGLESSPDYSVHAINHVGDVNTEKPSIRNNEDEGLNAYDDEYLDMNYSDMDLF